jgi:hypothetical protein
MKRWLYTATEIELVTLFTDRGYVGAQVYDADRVGPEWNESGRRLVALLDSAQRHNEATELNHASDARAKVDEIKRTFASITIGARRMLAHAYGPRRWQPIPPPRIGGARAAEDDCDPMAKEFHAETNEGRRTLNLLPATKYALDVFRKDVERARDLLERRIARERKKRLADETSERAMGRLLHRLTAELGKQVEVLQRNPTPLDLYAHFQVLAAARRLEKRRVNAIEREVEAIIEPALREYDTARRRRNTFKSKAKRDHVASIRRGES